MTSALAPETAAASGRDAASSPTRGQPAEYLIVLSLLAFSFMLFQMSVLREIRHLLSTLFTLTPFLFSAVIFFIGLGSYAARQVSTASHWRSKPVSDIGKGLASAFWRIISTNSGRSS